MCSYTFVTQWTVTVYMSVCPSVYSLNNPGSGRTAFLMPLVLLITHDSIPQSDSLSSRPIYPLSCCVTMGKLRARSAPVSPCIKDGTERITCCEDNIYQVPGTVHHTQKVFTNVTCCYYHYYYDYLCVKCLHTMKAPILYFCGTCKLQQLPGLGLAKWDTSTPHITRPAAKRKGEALEEKNRFLCFILGSHLLVRRRKSLRSEHEVFTCILGLFERNNKLKGTVSYQPCTSYMRTFTSFPFSVIIKKENKSSST